MRATWTSQLGIAVGTILVIATGTLLPFNSPIPPAEVTTPESQALNAATKLLWLAAVLVSRARQPRNPLWKVMLGYIFASEIWAFGHIPNALAASLTWVFARLDLAVLAHVLVAFPFGRLRGRLDRWAVGASYLLVVASYGTTVLFWEPKSDPASCSACPPNAFLLSPNPDVILLVERTASFISPIVGAMVLYAVWRHWQAAGPAARRSLLPVMLALPLTLVAPAGYVADALGIDATALGHVYDLGIILVPAALLAGVLRLRLDRGRVANLMVELGRGATAGGLRDALARALGDPTLQLAFSASTPGGYIDPAGHSVELPAQDPTRATARIERDGELLAVLIHDRTIDDDDPGLVEAVGTAARLAIDNERLTAQVRAQLEEVDASRARIVDAADAERRRVERDLHDGAQQRLVALAMRLQLAREASGDAGALIDEATAELQAAIGEVRDLARGIHPPILAEAGLGAALESLAERSPVPVRVEATDARYRPAIETTAFYVAAEALTNAARHGDATEIVISVVSEGPRLVVTIRDDGRGGADPAHGSGLRGLVDRVAAVGGQLTVSSPAGRGTTLRAELPLE
ncbi:MAG TPA: sensor histidine kinase [Candidatus Limnocylindrales bacterium]